MEADKRIERKSGPAGDRSATRELNFSRKLLFGGSCGDVGVFLVKALNAAGGVHQLLLARKEGVATGADFDAEHIALDGRTRLEGAPASAVNSNGMVVRMNTGFHGSPI